MRFIVDFLKNHTRGNLFFLLRKIYYAFVNAYRRLCVVYYYYFRRYPLEDKVVATTFNGKKYGDNPQYIFEQLHKLNPNLDFVWLKNPYSDYLVPDYVRTVSYNNEKEKAYELATAKVWINSHRMNVACRKRDGQLFIETWHGGLGIKKLDRDVPKFRRSKVLLKEVKLTSRMADLFISNSHHLTRIYRSAFDYKGKIWKCGYPKNDILFLRKEPYQAKVREHFKLPPDTKLLLYAPTFRDNINLVGFDPEVYSLDFRRLNEAVNHCWEGKWVMLARWHPVMVGKTPNLEKLYGGAVIDATPYPDMQELVLSCDAFISDYSSGIFDAALREIPCLTFATDFDAYKGDRGVYYEMEELPFPYARNNDELIYNIEHFDHEEYLRAWSAFKERTGYYETGHAAQDIAHVINEFVKGNRAPLDSIVGEDLLNELQNQT